MDLFTGHGDAAPFKINGKFFGVKRSESIRGRMAAKRGANARKKFFDAEGLGDIVVGTGIESDDLVALSVANCKNDDRSVTPTANFAAGFDTADARKIDVEQNKIGLSFARGLDGFFAGGSFGNNVAAEGKSGAQDAANLRFVVDDQYVGGTHREVLQEVATGRVKENTEPLPCWLVTEIVPPCAVTTALAMGRPMPVPRT